MAQHTLINLHPKECSQEFHCYPFAVKLDRCAGGCNTLNDLSNKVTTNVDVSVENVMHVKKIIFGILIHVVVKWKILSRYYG